MITDIIVKQAGVKGNGVFAMRAFARGEFIFRRRHGQVVRTEEIGLLSEEDQRHLCELDWDRSAVLLAPGCYLNHACDPNAMRAGTKVFAWRDIDQGEEITIDYRLNAFSDERWECSCKSANCQGFIIGSFFALSEDRQRLYLTICANVHSARVSPPARRESLQRYEVESFMIETARTIIRPYTEIDIDRVKPIFADPTTMVFWPQPLSEDAVAAWVRRASASFAATGLGRMLVELRAGGTPIGDCGIMEAEVNGRREHDLGYIIHHPYWRQGYGIECARAGLEYGIGTLGLKRIVANMAHDHVASARVAEQLGMRREATFHNPRNRNILTYLYTLNL